MNWREGTMSFIHARNTDKNTTRVRVSATVTAAPQSDREVARASVLRAKELVETLAKKVATSHAILDDNPGDPDVLQLVQSICQAHDSALRALSGPERPAAAPINSVDMRDVISRALLGVQKILKANGV